MITYILNIDYLLCYGFISYQHAALTAQMKSNSKKLLSDNVYADRINTGFDWVWVNKLVESGWIGFRKMDPWTSLTKIQDLQYYFPTNKCLEKI